MIFVDVIDSDDLIDTRIREDDVYPTVIGLDPLVKSSHICAIGNISLNADGSVSDFGHSFIKKLLPPTRDVYKGAFAGESFAVVRPMPSLPPVITTTLFSNRLVIFLPFKGSGSCLVSY